MEDVENKKILYRTFGILEFPSTLSYELSGFEIFIDEIDPLQANILSKEISINLEQSVPYDVKLIP